MVESMPKPPVLKSLISSAQLHSIADLSTEVDFGIESSQLRAAEPEPPEGSEERHLESVDQDSPSSTTVHARQEEPRPGLRAADLCPRFHGLIRSCCLQALGGRYRHLIDDAIQETYLRATRFLQKGGKVKAAESWLAKVARNTAANVRRSQQKHRVGVGDEDLADPRSEYQRYHDMLASIRSEITNTQNDVLDGILEGLTQQEIADRLGLTRQWVSHLVRRIRDVTANSGSQGGGRP